MTGSDALSPPNRSGRIAPKGPKNFAMFEETMKRRSLLWLSIVLATGLVLALAFPTSHYVLIGLLQNEAFYDGKPTSYWVSALQKRGYFGPEGPARDVGDILSKAGAAAVPVLVDMLEQEDHEVRFKALLALVAMKPGEAAAAAPALELTWLNEKTGLHAELAYRALVKADEDAAIRRLMTMLEPAESTKNRRRAASALGRLGPKKVAIEALRVALDDEDRDVRSQAARALWQIQRQVDTKLLLTLFQGEVWEDLGPEAQAAVPGLLQALQSPDETIRLPATLALGHLGPSILAKDAVRALAARLKDNSNAVRRAAARALGKTRASAVEAIPALLEALHDPDPDTRVAAAMSLGEIGQAARTAVPHLVRAIKEGEVSLRRTAVYALGLIGPAAKASVPDLIEALKDKDEHTRNCAAEALGRIGPTASTAIPALITALQDKWFQARESAESALARIVLAQVPIQ